MEIIVGYLFCVLYFGLNIFISINSTYIHTILRISNGIQKEAKRLIRICFPI